MFNLNQSLLCASLLLSVSATANTLVEKSKGDIYLIKMSTPMTTQIDDWVQVYDEDGNLFGSGYVTKKRK